ncbi:MAG: sulfotransferase [Wenzhouxiangella sp.]
MTENPNQVQRRAILLQQQGRLEEAIALHRKVLSLRPDYADGWYNLAYALRLAGQYEESLEAYARALEHNVSEPEEVHLNRAAILSDHLLRPDQAEAELRKALECNPDYLPGLLNLGNLHEERGEREEALAVYDRIIDTAEQTDPIGLEALARCAHLRPPESPGDRRLEQLEEACRIAPADHPVRANLLFSLGRACDRLGLHERAFEAFEAGNRSARRGTRPYNPAGFERLISALIDEFDRPVKATKETMAPPAPLFICGMFRSGSTLIERVLAAHPRIIAGGELDLLPRIVAGPLAPFPASMKKVTEARLRELAGTYLERLAALFPETEGIDWITDKRPDNLLFVGLIQRLFPGARVIQTHRHPMDNGLSVYMQHLDARVAPYANRLEDIGHYYARCRRLTRHWKRCAPERVFDFDYDAFVRDPEPQLKELLSFLDLEFDARCLAFHRQEATVKTASYWQVRQPLYRSASGRWKHYRQQLAPLERALAESGIEID